MKPKGKKIKVGSKIVVCDLEANYFCTVYRIDKVNKYNSMKFSKVTFDEASKIDGIVGNIQKDYCKGNYK